MASLFYMCSYFCAKEKMDMYWIYYGKLYQKILHILAKNSSRHF